MEKVSFSAKLRDKSVKAKNLRREDLIPAEYYGHGVDNLSLTLPYNDFRRLYKKSGSNTVIDLDVEGKGTKSVLIHNVENDPVTDRYIHVEFINVRMDEEVTTNIPIRLEGTAPAVKDLGGTLIQSLDELEVTCLPRDLVAEIVVNVDSLVDFNTIIHVSDLQIPKGMTVLADPETAVAAVSQPREEEPETTPEVDVASVEVPGEKPEGEGEVSAEGEAKEE